ncbi:unnamed protein product, partial [Polarella glacialis]
TLREDSLKRARGEVKLEREEELSQKEVTQVRESLQPALEAAAGSPSGSVEWRRKLRGQLVRSISEGQLKTALERARLASVAQSCHSEECDAPEQKEGRSAACRLSPISPMKVNLRAGLLRAVRDRSLELIFERAVSSNSRFVDLPPLTPRTLQVTDVNDVAALLYARVKQVLSEHEHFQEKRCERTAQLHQLEHVCTKLLNGHPAAESEVLSVSGTSEANGVTDGESVHFKGDGGLAANSLVTMHAGSDDELQEAAAAEAAESQRALTKAAEETVAARAAEESVAARPTQEVAAAKAATQAIAMQRAEEEAAAKAAEEAAEEAAVAKAAKELAMAKVAEEAAAAKAAEEAAEEAAAAKAAEEAAEEAAAAKAAKEAAAAKAAEQAAEEAAEEAAAAK